MKDFQFIEQARTRWAESGRSPDLFRRILPPLFAPYTTYGPESEWPKPRNLREAVDQLILRSTVQVKMSLLQLSPEDQGWSFLHLSPGMWIRNTFGLWGRNPALAKAIELYEEDESLLNFSPEEVELSYAEKFGDKEPAGFGDALSGPIIFAYWQTLQNYEWPELNGSWENVRFEE